MTSLVNCELPKQTALLVRPYLFRVVAAHVRVRPQSDVSGREHGGVHGRALAVGLARVFHNLHCHRQLQQMRAGQFLEDMVLTTCYVMLLSVMFSNPS